jgi:hypothetical protein
MGVAAALQSPPASAQDAPIKATSPVMATGVAAKPPKPASVAVARPSAPASTSEASPVEASAKHAGLAPTSTSANAANPTPEGKPAKKPEVQYYVDFRARTAASYGHAFLWYGRTDQRAVEVAGLHPATESVVPYIIGHALLVPSETGASYGDLDVQYLTANYRVFLNDADAKRVFAYIKHMQETSPVWNAATFNCVWFISSIAQYMGLKVPNSNVMYPEDWVNELKTLNGGRKVVRLTAAPLQATPSQ